MNAAAGCLCTGPSVCVTVVIVFFPRRIEQVALDLVLPNSHLSAMLIYALFVWLISYGQKHCWLIYCKRKIIFID